MPYSQIIREAWNLTTQNSKLKWLIFFPCFVAVIVFVLEVSWQVYLYLGEFQIFDSKLDFGSISFLINFLVEHNLFGWVIFLVVFTFVFSFIFPSWIQGALILGVNQKLHKPESYFSVRQKLIEAYEYFFRLFELHAILGFFSFASIAIFVASFYRFFHDSLFGFAWPIFVIYTICAIFVSLFLSFAPFFIVIEKEKLSPAIKKSIGLVFMNFGRTIALLLLMFLINFRVIINALLIMLVPFGIFAAFSYFASSLALFLSIFLGVVILGLAAYMTAILEVFSMAVWIRSFLEMKEEADKMRQDSE